MLHIKRDREMAIQISSMNTFHKVIVKCKTVANRCDSRKFANVCYDSGLTIVDIL